MQVVSDIPCGSSKFPAHFRYQKGDTQLMETIWQDMVLEMIREYHDGVIGQ